MATNNNLILDNLNGEYVKFYATNNGALKTLLNNSGNIIIYQDSQNENRIYTYLGDVLLSSGVGFVDEQSFKDFVDQYAYSSLLLNEHSEEIERLNYYVDKNIENIANLTNSYIEIPNTEIKVPVNSMFFNRIIPEYKSPEIISEDGYIEYTTSEFSLNPRFNKNHIAYLNNSSFKVPKNCLINKIHRNVVVKNNDEIITYYSSKIHVSQNEINTFISKINGSKNITGVSNIDINEYDYRDNNNEGVLSYNSNDISKSDISSKLICSSSYIYTSGTLNLKNNAIFKEANISNDKAYINVDVEATYTNVYSFEHFKFPTKLMLSDLYAYNYSYITTYTINNNNNTYAYTYTIIDDLDKRICITPPYTNNKDKIKNEFYIHKDFFIEKVEMFDNETQNFENISGLTIIDNTHTGDNNNKYVINTGKYYNNDIYVKLNKRNNLLINKGNNYSGLSWNAIQNDEYTHSNWITYNETITSSNISYLVNLTPITYNFYSADINYNNIITGSYLENKNFMNNESVLFIPKYYKDKCIVANYNYLNNEGQPETDSNRIMLGYNFTYTSVQYKDIEYAYIAYIDNNAYNNIGNYSYIYFDYDIVYIGNSKLTNPTENAYNIFTGTDNITITGNTTYILNKNYHKIQYETSYKYMGNILTLPYNYTPTGYLYRTDLAGIKQSLDIVMIGENNHDLFKYSKTKYYDYEIICNTSTGFERGILNGTSLNNPEIKIYIEITNDINK